MKKWLSPIPKECQICKHKFTEHDVFIDGKSTQYFGQWALMCENCWNKTGYKLGFGYGQKYSHKDGRLLKGGMTPVDDCAKIPYLDTDI
jgi:hypothetical protein